MKADAQIYDDTIWRAVPNYRECLSLIEKLIPTDAKTIVSIGTGTGNLEKMIFEKRPDVTIFGIDTNPEYMRFAQDKLSGYNFHPIVGDASRLKYPQADCICSALTIHHIENKEHVFDQIKNGKTFINFDIVKGADRKEHDSFVNYVVNHFKKQGFSEDFIAQERDIINGIGAGADIPISLEQNKAMLPGFNFKLEYKDHLLVVYKAVR
jgi:SAM-dependent methyltransferase